jgi:hypothetical protein
VWGGWLSKKPFQKELPMHRLTFDPGQRRVLLLVLYIWQAIFRFDFSYEDIKSFCDNNVKKIGSFHPTFKALSPSLTLNV